MEHFSAARNEVATVISAKQREKNTEVHQTRAETICQFN